jgi:hypothetical protein
MAARLEVTENGRVYRTVLGKRLGIALSRKARENIDQQPGTTHEGAALYSCH